MNKQPYESLGRDLYFKTKCTCPARRWIGTDIEHIMKTDVRLTGYADNNFFDNVHKESHNGACDCGRKFHYQWFRDGVTFEWEAAQ